MDKTQMDGNQTDKDSQGCPRAVRPDPGIELNMQALSINEPQVVHIQAEIQRQEKGQDAEFNILMKLAATGGPIRILSLPIVQQSMSRAWRQNYYGISQLSRYIFVAHFRSLQAAMFVITRQPWSMGSDNFLLEWMDPQEQDLDFLDYKFESVYVTIRVYGVPMKFRTQNLLDSILQSVGQISEFHPFNQSMLTAKHEYIWGTVKLKVSQSVRDKVWITFADDSAGWAYLFYERVGRICSFCGIMFHSVQHCPARNSLLMSRSRIQSVEHISPNRFGQWMTNAELVPGQIQPSDDSEVNSFTSFRNPHLARLQRQVLQSSKGKEKVQNEGSSELETHKDLSIRKINNLIARAEGGETSKNLEIQFSHRQNDVSTLSPNLIQGASQGQSGAMQGATAIGLVHSAALNTDTEVMRCNNARDRTVGALKEPVQVCTTLSDPVQPGGATQSEPLSQILSDPLYTPEEEINILAQRVGPVLDQMTTQQGQPPLGQITSSSTCSTLIPSSSTPDASRQIEPAIPSLQPNILAMPPQSVTHSTQAHPTAAIPASMVDKNPSTDALLTPKFTHGSPSITFRSPPHSHTRSAAKRPSESLLGLPLPPAKKLIPHGAGGDERGQQGSGSQGAERRAEDQVGAGPLFSSPRAGSHSWNQPSLLGAPPSRPIHIGQASLIGGLGAGTGDGTGRTTQQGRNTEERSSDSRTMISRPAMSQRGVLRSRVSRWDVPPVGRPGGVRPHNYGVLRGRGGSYSWHRDGGSSSLDRGQVVGCLDIAASVEQDRPSFEFGQEEGACYDPWPLRSPALSVSSATASSYQGPVSPPGIDHFNNMDRDAVGNLHCSEAQVTVEKQDDTSTTRLGNTLDIQEGQLGEDMDFESEAHQPMAYSFSRAAAHGPNAPRAP